jgi:hypothetical protein
VAKTNKLVSQDNVVAIVGGNSGIRQWRSVPLLKKEVPFSALPDLAALKHRKLQIQFLDDPSYDDAIESLVKYSIDKLNCKTLASSFDSPLGCSSLEGIRGNGQEIWNNHRAGGDAKRYRQRHDSTTHQY